MGAVVARLPVSYHFTHAVEGSPRVGGSVRPVTHETTKKLGWPVWWAMDRVCEGWLTAVLEGRQASIFSRALGA